MADRRRVWVGEDDGRLALLVDGVVQSVALESAAGQGVGLTAPDGGYWTALLPNVRPRRALILGLGGGTLVHLLHRRFGELQVIGIEDDAEVLEIARADFGLHASGLEVVQQDAFEYVQTCQERFDFICVDLFRGAQLERRILAQPFLRRLKAIATPGAEITVNLFKDRRTGTHVERIGKILTVREARQIGKNVVVRAGVR